MSNNTLKESVFLQMVNELYIGKTPGVLNIERCVTNLRNMLKDNAFKGAISNVTNANLSKEIIALNTAIEHEFGFKHACVTVTAWSTHKMSSFIPIGRGLDARNLNKKIKVDKHGIRYSRGCDYSIIIYCSQSLLLYEGYTDAEVTALLLSTIGHSFDVALSKSCNTLQKVASILNLVCVIMNIASNFTVLLTAAPRDKIVEAILYMKKKYPNECLLFDSFCSGFVKGMEFFGGALYISLKTVSIIPLFSIPYGIASGLANLVRGRLLNFWNVTRSYKGHFISDDFVTTLGYGAELASANQKFFAVRGGNAIDNYIDKEIPFLAAYLDVMNIGQLLLDSIFTARPIEAERFNQQVDYLKKELDKSDITPQIRKEINTQISSIKASLMKIKLPNETHMNMDNIDPLIMRKNMQSIASIMINSNIGYNLSVNDIHKSIDKLAKVDGNIIVKEEK